jgi:fibronectin type 3 domain-containing protein
MTAANSRIRRLPALVLLVLLSGACEQVSVTAVPAARVQVSPSSTVLGIGGSAQLTATVFSDGDQPLSGRPVSWSSENTGIATVDDSGQVVGVSAGTVTIHAESEGVAGSASVLVTTAPALGPAPAVIEFTAVEGGATPGDRTVTVTNVGQGSLTGMSAAIRYPDGHPTGWLGANLSSPVAPASLTLSANHAGLAAGTHTAYVDLASDVAANSPVTVTVTLQVLTPAPAIGLSTTVVAFNATQNGAAPAPQTVAVTNVGAGTLSGLSATVTYTAGQPTGWLAASLNPTTAPAILSLAASPGSLAPGTYTATVQVAASVAQNSPQSVTVTLTVAAPTPLIAATPTLLSFSGQQGAGNPATQTVQITNSGGGSLTGLAVSITYPGGQPAGWVTTSLNQTTAPATLTVGAQTGALTTGTYTAQIRITSPVAGNNPVIVDVTFDIAAPAPAIMLDRSSVSFSIGALDGNPPPQLVQVTNGGGGTLSGLGVSVLGQNSGWLSAELSATTAPATITLTATRGALTPGTYNAVLRVTSAVASNSPVDIPVTLTIAVGPPSAPSSLTATAVSDRRVNLGWQDTSSDEARFEIQRQAAGGDWSDRATTGVNETTFADSVGLTGSTEYSYRVRACNAVGCSDWSNIATATTAPVAPSGATAIAASTSQITVSWTDNSPDETGFRVERSSNGGQTWTLATTAAADAVSFEDSGLAAGTTYRYRVSACRGTLCSGFSNEAEATTSSGTTTIPSTPTNLSATATSPTTVLLTWTAPGGQDSYELRRRTGTSGPFTYTVVVPNSPSYEDTGLAPGTTYQYQIRACSAGGCSNFSSQVTVTTPAAD